MAIFAISDVIISLTLSINAFALMSTRLIALGRKSSTGNGNSEQLSSSLSPSPSSIGSLHVSGNSNRSNLENSGELGLGEGQSLLSESEGTGGSSEKLSMNAASSDSQEYSLSSRLARLALLIRSLSATMVVWNIIFFN